jgi:hypothetical protein
VNGIFTCDAERDEVILRIEERLRETLDDVKEIKDDLKALHVNFETISDLEARVARLEVWEKVITMVSTSIVSGFILYLITQRILH